jgi:hypothetical protein
MIGRDGEVFDHVEDSGERQKFSTGSVRDTQKGKGRFDLIPVDAMFRLAVHYENGAEKYGERNWEKGQPLSRYLNSALRHTYKVLLGYTDEDHASAAVWNIFGYLHTLNQIREGKLPESLDDLGHSK